VKPPAGVIRPQSARVKGLSPEIFTVEERSTEFIVWKTIENVLENLTAWHVFRLRGLRPWYDNERSE
jgi:hypothetical protein